MPRVDEARPRRSHGRSESGWAARSRGVAGVHGPSHEALGISRLITGRHIPVPRLLQSALAPHDAPRRAGREGRHEPRPGPASCARRNFRGEAPRHPRGKHASGATSSGSPRRASGWRATSASCGLRRRVGLRSGPGTRWAEGCREAAARTDGGSLTGAACRGIRRGARSCRTAKVIEPSRCEPGAGPSACGAVGSVGGLPELPSGGSRRARGEDPAKPRGWRGVGVMGEPPARPRGHRARAVRSRPRQTSGVRWEPGPRGSGGGGCAAVARAGPGSRGLSVLQRPAHGGGGRAPDRRGRPAPPHPAVGAIRAQAVSALPAPDARGSECRARHLPPGAPVRTS